MWLNMLSRGKLCSRPHLSIKFFLKVGFYNGLIGLINYQCKKISRTVLEYNCTLKGEREKKKKKKKKKKKRERERDFKKLYVKAKKQKISL